MKIFLKTIVWSLIVFVGLAGGAPVESLAFSVDQVEPETPESTATMTVRVVVVTLAENPETEESLPPVPVETESSGESELLTEDGPPAPQVSDPSAVPEPSSLILLFLGFLSMAGIVKWSKRKKKDKSVT